MIMMASRADLIDKAGKMPTTFEELIDVCEAIPVKRMAAFTADKLHHWNFIPYLMGHGGGVFKDPPGNLTPTWDTLKQQLLQSITVTITKYGPPEFCLLLTLNQCRLKMDGPTYEHKQLLGVFHWLKIQTAELKILSATL